jgi:signal transduction histidine kinase
MVLKYVRIYNTSFEEKGVRLEVTGESFGEIRADSSALGVIPQTFLDNALKYAPRESKATVSFKEYEDFIILAITSYGPKIEADEQKKIFELFYRGRNAMKEQEEGAGFGLHLAQFVAKSIGSEIVVHQSTVKTRFGYETTFSVRFPREKSADCSISCF